MSHSSIFKIDTNGDVVLHQNFPNSFQGAILIWADFAHRYGITSKDDRFIVLSSVARCQHVWDLIKIPDLLPRHEKIVMLATWDNRLCKKEDFPELIEAFRKYHDQLDVDDKHCHTAAWADAIEELPEDCLGCGWLHTSVAKNPWRAISEPATEQYDAEYRPYNIHIDNNHAFIFDELKSNYS